jgi:hypothetical protein
VLLDVARSRSRPLPQPQFATLFIRSVRVRRFETLSQQDLAQFLSVAAVCGMIWWQVGQSDTVYGAQNTMGLLFFEGEAPLPTTTRCCQLLLLLLRCRRRGVAAERQGALRCQLSCR